MTKTLWFCYVLRNTEEKYKSLTYIGASNDPFERLRRHNGELSGGARSTNGKGKWEIWLLLSGFESYSEAMMCEWRLKHPIGRTCRGTKYSGVQGKIESLKYITALDTWGKKDNLLKRNNIKIFILHDSSDNLNDEILGHLEINKVSKIDKLLFDEKNE